MQSKVPLHRAHEHERSELLHRHAKEHADHHARHHAERTALHARHEAEMMASLSSVAYSRANRAGFKLDSEACWWAGSRTRHDL